MDTHRHYRNFLEWNTNGTRFLPIFLNGDELTSIPGTYGLQQVIHNIFADLKGMRNGIVSLLEDSDFTVTGGVGSEKLNIGKNITMIIKGIFGRYTETTYPPGASVLSDPLYANKYLVFDINETTHVVSIVAVDDWKSLDGIILGKVASDGSAFTLITEKTYIKVSPDDTQTIFDTNAHEYFNPFVYYNNNMDIDVTGTGNINASGNTTLQWGASTKLTVDTNGITIPDIDISNNIDVNGTMDISGNTTFDGTGNYLDMNEHDIKNVVNYDGTKITIDGTGANASSITEVAITTINNTANFTAQPTITLGGNAGDIVDTYRFPNVIHGDASNDGAVNFNIDLQGNYIYYKQPTGNAQHSGVVIKRDKAGAASLPSNGKFVSIDANGYAGNCGDNDFPSIGIKIGDNAASTMYILTSGYYRMSSGDNSANIGKVIYKSTTGGFTTNPSSLTYAQAVGVITHGGADWTEILINPSTVIVIS